MIHSDELKNTHLNPYALRFKLKLIPIVEYQLYD